ncbi:nitroreductase family protein [Treponema primitia ZAS-2]|uniref:Nitroreductase family protein n=1 Tax=Treponema primitia (strain ATCC BAA-887 / DSM 12427 / ZAS-2) TaxID=545694 RepID=F5YN15_TREPZ|nr:nitroreductase family protein [Treponema primitia]AEF85622.1 nitroreductase family protein [Treponema primitia ZAS-2]
MKKIAFLTSFALAVLIFQQPNLFAADVDARAIGVITGHYAPRNFAAGSVSRTDLDKILSAAVRAPSASNRQPWHFTVVQDQNLTKQIVSNITDGNILIVISGPGDSKTNGAVMLDCGLATQSIYLAAQSLGLGSRIYTGPIDALNSKLKADLGLPSGYSAVALVRIGRLPAGADAVSGASTRKALNDLVTYK